MAGETGIKLDSLPPQTSGNIHLFSYIQPFLGSFILSLFFLVMVALFTVLLPVVIEPLINELSRQGTSSALSTISLDDSIREFLIKFFNIKENELAPYLPYVLLFVFFGQAVFSFPSLYYMKTLGLKVIRDIRDKVYNILVNQSVDFLSHARTGDLTSRLSSDIEIIRYSVSETLQAYIREGLTLLGLIIFIFLQNWRLSLISMVVLPLAALPLTYFGKHVKRRGIQSQETIAELSNFLTETVAGNKIVKAYNMEEFEIEKFHQMNQKHYRINSKIAMLYSLASPVMTFLGGLVACGIFAMGTQRISAGGLSAGQFASFFLSMLMMYNPIKRLSQAHNDYQQGKAGFYRISQLTGTQNPISDSASAKVLKNVQGEVVFKNVSFSYQPGQPVIRNVSFSASPGQMIALVGASGSGKSTLMNLLLRFYETHSGEILIDGQNIRDVTLKSLRNAISLVTQDVFIFNDTIENNIVYGSKDFTRQDIRQAVEIARARQFIEVLPKGYQTMAGERGGLFSTGQRQRISIARAIMKKPAILIFDEATSSLDSESERLIQEAMVDVMKGRTTFVIAHRLSTIIEADKILVIQGGEIKESGNHKELLVKRGLYYSLYNLQFPEMDIKM